MQKSKPVTYDTALELELFKHIVTRPKGSHPHPAHWEKLKELARAETTARLGKFECNSCWATPADHPFELHHRHYDNWGHETLADVNYLCEPCHFVITNRIRGVKYAHGWRDPDTLLWVEERPTQDKPNMSIDKSTPVAEGVEINIRINANEKVVRILEKNNPENLGNDYIKTR